MTFKLQEVDRITPQSKLIHKEWPDLVNNFVYYHKNVNNGDNKLWDNPPPKYTNYQSIEDIKDDIINNPTKYIEEGPITVKCKASWLYTCDGVVADQERTVYGAPYSLGTYDRLHDYQEIMHKAGQFMKQQNGFSPKSDVLHGTVRWTYDRSGNVKGFTIVKDRGNLRTHIGIASVAGSDVELLITLDFHKINPKLSLDELISIESETFFEDAMDRRGFNAKTKFRAGVLSGRKMFLCQAEFLDKVLKVDYAEAINTQRIKEGKTPHKYSLSSLAKLDFGKDGKPTGYISKFGEDNIKAAVGLLKTILDARKENTEMSVSAIHAFTKTFYFLTETPKSLGIKNSTAGAISNREELSDALTYMFTRVGRHGNFDFNMKDLHKTNSEKDTTWLAFKSYMELLLEDLRVVKGRTNNFRSNHPCIQAYIQDIGEKYNKAEAAKIVDR